MAVNNTLAPKKDEITAVFNANGKEVKLTPTMVKRFRVSGDASNVTFEEVSMFINLCKYNGLNPWLKEAYLIKFGTNPATLVVGKEAYLKRAESHNQYDGAESGVIVLTNDRIVYRTGTVTLDGEQIIGGWAEVFRKDRSHSTRCEVSFKEYAGYSKDGKLNRQWNAKPATMIRKVALVQALREAFPTIFGGMYTAEEQGYVEEETAVEVPANPAEVQVVEKQEQQAQQEANAGDGLPL